MKKIWKQAIRDQKTFLLRGAVFLLFFILFASCSTNYGYLKENRGQVTLQAIKQALPDYSYYYAGRSNLPYAVIGIDKKYNFNGRDWFKIEDRPGAVKKIKNLDDRAGKGVSSHVIYADIVDSTGEKVGIWFSYYRYTVVKVDPDSHKVVVFNPYIPEGINALP